MPAGRRRTQGRDPLPTSPLKGGGEKTAAARAPARRQRCRRAITKCPNAIALRLHSSPWKGGGVGVPLGTALDGRTGKRAAPSSLLPLGLLSSPLEGGGVRDPHWGPLSMAEQGGEPPPSSLLPPGRGEVGRGVDPAAAARSGIFPVPPIRELSASAHPTSPWKGGGEKTEAAPSRPTIAMSAVSGATRRRGEVIPRNLFRGDARRASPGGPAGAETPTPPGPWPTAPRRRPKIVPRTMVRFTRRARTRIVRRGRGRGASWTGNRRARTAGRGARVRKGFGKPRVFNGLRRLAGDRGAVSGAISARSCPG